MFEQWITLSLISPLIWAFGNVWDRFLCVKGIKNEYALAVIYTVARLPVFLILWWISGWYVPSSLSVLLLALLSGAFVILPSIFYFKALKHADSSHVMLIYYSLSPLVTFVLSIVFLGDRFDIYDMAGSAFLLSAVIFSVVKFQRNFLVFNRGILWLLVGCLIWPISDVLVKYLTPSFPSVLTLATWEDLGGFLAIFVLFLFPEFIRNARPKNFKWSPTIWAIVIFNVILFQVGLFTFFKALSLEKVALVIIVTSMQPLMNFAFELVAQKIFPEFERMDLSWRSLLPKGLAFCLMVIGIIFFNF